MKQNTVTNLGIFVNYDPRPRTKTKIQNYDSWPRTQDPGPSVERDIIYRPYTTLEESMIDRIRDILVYIKRIFPVVRIFEWSNHGIKRIKVIQIWRMSQIRNLFLLKSRTKLKCFYVYWKFFRYGNTVNIYYLSWVPNSKCQLPKWRECTSFCRSFLFVKSRFWIISSL